MFSQLLIYPHTLSLKDEYRSKSNFLVIAIIDTLRAAGLHNRAGEYNRDKIPRVGVAATSIWRESSLSYGTQG